MITRLRAKTLAISSPHALVSSHEPSSVREALLDSKWAQAMADEYKALENNHKWDLVPFSSDMNLIGNKWVFQIKYNSDGYVLKHKAWLVAKGFFQNPGVDYGETFSPVAKAPTIRVLFSLAVQNGWDIQQVDVNNTFLNDDLDETVFMVQPEGFLNSRFPNHVC